MPLRLSTRWAWRSHLFAPTIERISFSRISHRGAHEYISRPVTPGRHRRDGLPPRPARRGPPPAADRVVRQVRQRGRTHIGVGKDSAYVPNVQRRQPPAGRRPAPPLRLVAAGLPSSTPVRPPHGERRDVVGIRRRRVGRPGVEGEGEVEPDVEVVEHLVLRPERGRPANPAELGEGREQLLVQGQVELGRVESECFPCAFDEGRQAVGGIPLAYRSWAWESPAVSQISVQLFRRSAWATPAPSETRSSRSSSTF